MAWWGWLLQGWAITTYLLVGSRWKWCWFVAIGQEAAWITYGLLDHQIGFAVGAVVFIGIYIRNEIVWRKTGAFVKEASDATDTGR